MTDTPHQKLRATVSKGDFPEQLETAPLVDALREKFGDKIVESHSFRGDQTVIVQREALLDVMKVLRDEAPFEMHFLMDQTVVDRLEMGKKPRFEVVYHLFNRENFKRIRVKVQVSEDDCWIDSVKSLWLAADWMEREAWEFYGIDFRGHGDLRNVLLYPEFEGYPLRKDYPKDGEQPRLPLRDHRSWPRPKPADIT